MAALSDIDVTPLVDAGFKKLTKAEWQAEVERLKALGMDNGGTYDFGYELKDERRACSILIEQNVSTNAADGLETMTRHPAVATVIGPRGRVTCMANDTDLILAMVTEVTTG